MLRRRRVRACSFSSLPVELVNGILDHLRWPFDFHAVSLVSKAFNHSATPYLYRTIVVSHSFPAATLRMLEMLQACPETAAFVQAIVLDETVTALFSPLPQRSLVAEALHRMMRRKRPANPDIFRSQLPPLPAPDEQLRNLAMALWLVVPNLRNLRELFVRLAHPYIVANCSWYTPSASPSRLRALGDRVRRSLRMAPLRTSVQPTPIDYYSFHRNQQDDELYDWNLWEALELQQLHARLPFQRLSITGLDSSCTRLMGPINKLHVLHIALRSVPSSFESWRGLLSNLRSVDTLCITGHGRARLGAGCLERFLPHCVFKGLRVLQIWNASLCTNGAIALQGFICAHAGNLEIIALSVTFSPHVGFVVPLPVLSHHPQTGVRCDFPRLHTLRLDNVEQASCFGCIYRKAGTPLAHPRSPRDVLAVDLALEALRRFVAEHKGITDLALTGLHDAETLAAIEHACTQREMRRMLFGQAFDHAFRQHAMERGPGWRTKAERWVFHEVLFKDLELSRPEYSSALLAVGLPRNRLLHRHGY